MKNHGLLERMRFSLAGLSCAWRRERSMRLQLIYSASALALAGVVSGDVEWTAILFLSLAMGLTAEILNAAIEALCDRVHPGHHPEIGAVKDMASAAAFVANCASGALVVLTVLRPSF